MTDSYYFNHSPTGIAYMEKRRNDLISKQRALKEDVLGSPEGQKMVHSKLEDAEEAYAVAVRELRALKRSAATCHDRNDWFYEWMIEQYEGSNIYRGILKVKKAQVWKWRMLSRPADGSVSTPTQGSMFNLEAIREVPIESLIPYEPTWRGGQRWTYRCPVHNERTASFVLYREQNRWHCFGCGQGGSVIDLLMKIENLSFIEACHRLTS